jgi:hypothetical protein
MPYRVILEHKDGSEVVLNVPDMPGLVEALGSLGDDEFTSMVIEEIQEEHG